MYDTLFETGSLEIHAYPFFLCVAFLACSFLIPLLHKRIYGTPIVTPVLGMVVFLLALPGAKLFYIVQYRPATCQYFNIFSGGLVFYGGFLGGLLAVAIYAGLAHLSFLRCLDLAAIGVTLGEAIVRMGCFFHGCCWGKPAKLPWCVQFPKYSSVWRQHVDVLGLPTDSLVSLPVHPTQLYMAIGLVAIFAVLLSFIWKKPPSGHVAILYCLFYPLLRFPVEWLRGDTAYNRYGLTVSQCLAMLQFGIGIAAMMIQERGLGVRQGQGKNQGIDPGLGKGE